MTSQIAALSTALNQAGFKVNPYPKRERWTRLYLNNYGRDITAYITFDEPERDATEVKDTSMGLYSGCALKVFCEADQSPAWIANRRKQIKHEIMLKLVGASIVPGPICERWQDVIL